MKANASLVVPPNATSILAKFQHETLFIEAVTSPKLVPKKLADRAVQDLMRAISRTGQQILPVLIDDQQVIVAGFDVFAAMQGQGAKEIGVVRLSKLTKSEIKAIMLLLAKVPERSDWDPVAIASIVHEIAIEDPDALNITGLDLVEIDIATVNLDGYPSAASSKSNTRAGEEGLTAPVPTEPSIVELGDVFQLGNNRVICGNSLEAETHTTLMQGQLATVVVTDPPYNIPIAGHVSGMGKNKHADFAMGVGEMSFVQYITFLRTLLTLVVAALQSGGLLFVFMDRRHLEELFRAVRETNLRLVDLAIWNKLSGGMGGLYRGQHEPCLIAQAGSGPLINNVQLGKFGRYRTNVWDFRGYSAFGKDRNAALAAHPTVKPWPMLAEIILDCTKRGDIIVDPFLGSGSAILAAEKTNRRCFGIELEPKYVEIAITRWESTTGEEAVHQASGLTFSELRAVRQPKPGLQIGEPLEGENGHD